VSEAMRTSVTPEFIAELLRRSGYRANIAQHNGAPQVQSAAQGLGFFVGFGNAAGEDGAYVDISFHCWLSIQGELPVAVIESWNAGMRFARLFRREELLILTMDVMAAGGVAEAHLTAHIEIWDRLIHDFIRHLRTPAPGAQENAA
jgi:Putative bacterial sensory transduction regulator